MNLKKIELPVGWTTTMNKRRHCTRVSVSDGVSAAIVAAAWGGQQPTERRRGPPKSRVARSP